MNRLPLCLALAALAGLLLAVPASGAKTDPAPSPIAAIAEARTLIRTGRFEEALGVLRPLAEGRRANADVAFLFGLAAVGAADKPGLSDGARDALLDEAIGVFHAMLVERPGLLRVRLELARAFFLRGRDGLARRHFGQVLAGNPPAGVALNVHRFLGEIRARKRWTMRLGFALAPDTNIGAGSDDRIIYIHGLPFRRNQEELTSSGIGVSAWAGGEYQYPLADPGTRSGASRWRLRAGADIWRREYRESDFDRMSLAAYLGPRWLIGRGTEASLLASVQRHWSGNDPDHRALGFRVEGRQRLSRRTMADARVSWHERRYDERTNLDGPAMDVSLGAGWVASPTLRIDAALGWGQERPEEERWRHERRWVQLGASVALPWGFTVGGSGTLRWTDYEGNWFPFTEDGSPRRDLIRSLRLSAHNRAFTLEGFSPQVSVVQEQRTSNAQLHDYERISGELRFVRLF